MHNIHDVTRRNGPEVASSRTRQPLPFPTSNNNSNNGSANRNQSFAHSPSAQLCDSLPATPAIAVPYSRNALEFPTHSTRMPQRPPQPPSRENTPTTHYIMGRLVAAAPPRLRRQLRIRTRSVAAGALILLLTLTFVFFDLVYDAILEYHARPSFTASAEVWGVEEFDAPTGSPAVLVQHEGAMRRLNVTLSQACGALPALLCQANNVRLSPQLLPSWTLRVVDPWCTECTDLLHYAKTVKGVPLVADHAVYATSSTPLGRIGPMLYAMSSVTDDVDVKTELPKWSWLRHVYTKFATPFEDDAADVTPYLAVMGVPSTDQPTHVALRTAQRRTWMSYSEVARNENDFNGALLPLYLFAAVEPSSVGGGGGGAEAGGDGEGGKGNRATLPILGALDGGEAGALLIPVAQASSTGGAGGGRATLDPYTYHNASSIAPTVQEFEYATQARASAHYNEDSVHYTHRRVNLREGWRDGGATATAADMTRSPCDRIATHTVNENDAPSALTTLTTTLGLAVTPAFVSGAQFICHASAELWREALKHRNVVWIDMMTDRQPLASKKPGEPAGWSLAGEVGMSQKMILWLEYAYHAFPDVPYIIKGDDDAYMKVPQFLSDLRMVVADAAALSADVTVKNYMRQPFHESFAAAAKGLVVHAPGKRHKNKKQNQPQQQQQSPTTAAVALNVSVAATPCVYWGSLRLHHAVRYAAGMTFMVHRHVAHAVLSPSLRRRKVDVVKLATHTYHPRNTRAYRRSMFHREDVLLGLLVNASMAQAERYCVKNRVFFVREGVGRFHDLHAGKTHDLTWSTVVAHHSRPADFYYLHYFFQQEQALSTAELPRGVTAEAHAQQHVRDWVVEQREALPVDVVGWDALPTTRWTHAARRAPAYVLSPADEVTVYKTPFHRLQHLETRVKYGYTVDPR